MNDNAKTNNEYQIVGKESCGLILAKTKNGRYLFNSCCGQIRKSCGYFVKAKDFDNGYADVQFANGE